MDQTYFGEQPTKLELSQLEVKTISAKVASRLNEKWHSRLPRIPYSNIVRNTHHVCYGIFFKANPIGVGIWSSPVAQNRLTDGKKILELRRMALSDSCPHNTATWFLKKMIKDIKRIFPDIIKLISYQDTSVHNGIIYKAGNWVIDGETKFASWTTKTRKRNTDQATGKKIRWAYVIDRKLSHKKSIPSTPPVVAGTHQAA